MAEGSAEEEPADRHPREEEPEEPVPAEPRAGEIPTLPAEASPAAWEEEAEAPPAVTGAARAGMAARAERR
jgi:hypothetical protein